MAEPINLNRARKVRARAEAKSKAAENRVAFGRPKADREISRLEGERAGRAHDAKKRED